MSAPDWTDQEVESVKTVLTGSQVERLLAMMEVLRDPANLRQIAEIKDNCEVGDPDDPVEEWHSYARVLFDEFTHDEQRALWVAPTKGGIFTTHERKVLKNAWEGK